MNVMYMREAVKYKNSVILRRKNENTTMRL